MFFFILAKFLRRVRCTVFTLQTVRFPFFSGQSRCHGSLSGRRSVDEVGGGLCRSMTFLATSQNQGGLNPPFLQTVWSRGVALTQTDLGLEAWVGFKVLTQSPGFLRSHTNTSGWRVPDSVAKSLPRGGERQGPPAGCEGVRVCVRLPLC